MKIAIKSPLLAITLSSTLLWSGASIAQSISEDTANDAAATGGTAAVNYELHDHADSPPVNYRSAQDPRYDTKQQHDAEMYAEQFEKKRAEDDARQKQFLDQLNKTPRGSGIGINNTGNIESGFPAR